MKIFTIVGARPNFIKIDPELKQTIIHSGQHYDYQMSQVFFDELEIPKPVYNLNCKNKVGKMIDKLMTLFKKEKPNIIIVFGDTYTALAGALAAAYTNIPIVHIEAGLRSYNLNMPEEVNRTLIDKLALLKFCPNNESAMNLLKEGIKDNIHVVGDPMFDTMGKFLPIPKGKDYENYIFITLHRNFNADNKEALKNVLDALKESEEKFIFPIHPRTKRNLAKFKLIIPKNIEIVNPKTYKETLILISNAKKVITDSGGIQKEAFWMNKPLIILRDETEWTEIVTKNGGILVGTDKEKIKDAVKNFKNKISIPPIAGANKKIREIVYKYV